MELIRGVHNLRARHRGCVATIGNFDGVHLGHRAVLTELARIGRATGLPTLAMIFEPQPAEVFLPNPRPRITRLGEKLAALARLPGEPLDRVLCAAFGGGFAAITAQQFISELLVAKLGVRHLVVGPDFRFGKGRQGDVALLQHAGRQHGFEVSHMQPFLLNGQRVSSTLVRDALERGDLAAARAWLGHDYAIYGRVAHGDKRGRTIGFPTANIRLHRRNCCLHGVFAVEVVSSGSGAWHGVANIGTRPTVGGQEVVLEVHLLDYSGDLYGAHLSVVFRQRLRDERRFAGLDALKAQIARDIAAAREIFGRQTGPAARLPA